VAPELHGGGLGTFISPTREAGSAVTENVTCYESSDRCFTSERFVEDILSP
jgi:hypothetical protein